MKCLKNKQNLHDSFTLIGFSSFHHTKVVKQGGMWNEKKRSEKSDENPMKILRPPPPRSTKNSLARTSNCRWHEDTIEGKLGIFLSISVDLNIFFSQIQKGYE